jgi:PAP2 superfamily protein
MKWPTWYHGVLLAAVCVVVWWVLGRVRASDRRPDTRAARAAAMARPAAQELAVVATLYAIWRLARKLPLATAEGAIERARQLDDLQRALGFPSELSLQHFVLDYDWLGRVTNIYYATVHVPATIAFLVWLFVRHRNEYPHWRNGLAIVTGLCLVIRFVRVAPPRFLPELGYIDLASKYGLSVYGPVGTGVSDQFAAMPSIHVAWAAVVSFGIIGASTSKWRWVFALQVILTMLAVSASGNHWWLDGIVAIALLGIALAIDTFVRRAVTRRRAMTDLDAFPDGAPVLAAARSDADEGSAHSLSVGE